MKLSRNYVALLLALAATCLFGRMGFVASAGAFENAEPTRFQQFVILWISLSWIVPALLIGTLISRQVMLTAASVRLVGSLVLVAWEYPSFIPSGSYLPDPPSLLLSMAVEVVSGVPCAVVLAWMATMFTRKFELPKFLLAVMLVPGGLYAAFAGTDYMSHTAALAQWAPDQARIEAANDIKAGSMKIYRHGSFTASAVGVEEAQRSLVRNLPVRDAGVGCIVRYDDVFEEQLDYAMLYNKAIVEYLQTRDASGERKR